MRRVSLLLLFGSCLTKHPLNATHKRAPEFLGFHQSSIDIMHFWLIGDEGLSGVGSQQGPAGAVLPGEGGWRQALRCRGYTRAPLC